MIKAAVILLRCDGPGCHTRIRISIPRPELGFLHFSETADAARAAAMKEGWARHRWHDGGPLGDYCPACVARRNWDPI